MNVHGTVAELIASPHKAAAIIVEHGGERRPCTDLRESGSDKPVYRLPPLFPEWLGDRKFTAEHGIRFPYVVGEMARGIATPRMVIAAADAGLLGFYGSAGLQPDEIRHGIEEINSALGPKALSWGANLIHAPQQPGYESAVVDLFLRTGVRRVSASAFMKLTPEVVRYAALGLRRSADGAICRENHLFAKVSRAEVAEQFMAPAPQTMLRELVAAGRITNDHAALAAQVAVAAEITAESDSGGHTDNRPAGVLFSSLAHARDRVASRHNMDANAIRIGLAGGIATPQTVAAAFQMGAAYVLTGSINQAAAESGLSELGRRMLSEAGPADVKMAPAADMFEQGVKVQVLKRGTMFALRAERLYRMYRSGRSFEALTADERAWFEKVLGESFQTAWSKTKDYLEHANPKEARRAEADPNKRLALVARRYLFMGAQHARDGNAARKTDFQIWCGPAMGAFNEWVAGSFLESIENRTVRQIAWNLLEGAAMLTRAAQLRSFGVAVPSSLMTFVPRRFEEPVGRGHDD